MESYDKQGEARFALKIVSAGRQPVWASKGRKEEEVKG